MARWKCEAKSSKLDKKWSGWIITQRKASVVMMLRLHLGHLHLNNLDKPSTPPVTEIQGWKSSFESSRLCFWDRTGTSTHIGESGLKTLSVSSAEQAHTHSALKFYNGVKMELLKWLFNCKYNCKIYNNFGSGIAV